MYGTKIGLTIFIVLLFNLLSCKRGLNNDEKFIQNLSNDLDFELPIANESLMIFINKNDTVYVTSLRQLYFANEKNYKRFENFDDFLIKVLNNDLLTKIELDIISKTKFILNKNIEIEFNQNGLDYFKSNYCEKIDTTKKLYMKNSLAFDIKFSVMYFFFKNNYYVGLDDYLGKYILIDKTI